VGLPGGRDTFDLTRRTVLSQVLPTRDRNRYETTASNFTMACHEAEVIGILPYGQTRTRCPPGIDDFGVWASVGAYPLKEVENQSPDSI